MTCSTRMAAQPNGGAQPNSADRAGGGRVIIGRVFEDQDFRGRSFTITAAHPCWDGNGRDWSVQLAKYGWANRISSVQAWGNCWLNLYSGPNLNGQHDGPYKTDTPYVGPQLDKRAQSIGFD
ncbi:peptidase inhibitor family I36 protein [Amycolatopsis sp. NPDC059657]|uniref:peptidase inhibitor family I36 protein n=1 Tax=Amycolatopsis sp. NPDC059657 TaxID=3346899 RepID=UPI00366D8DCC